MSAIECKPMLALLVLLLSISGASTKCKDTKSKRWCFERLHLEFHPLKQRSILSQCKKTFKACDAPDCRPGFMLSKKYKCVDIDECSLPELNDCGQHALCTNSEGSFTCRCPPDKPFGDPRQKCSAPNPCDDGTHKCPKEAVCVKAWDDYRCQCPDGKMAVYLEDTCQYACHDKVKCKVWGDPHFTTYDKKKMDHQGICTYTLSSTECPPHIPPLPKGLKHFNINIKNQHLEDRKKTVSFLEYLDISFGEDKIRIYSNKTVIVNGMLTSLPYQSDDKSYVILVAAKTVTLLVPIGLKVVVKHPNDARVYIDETYKTHVCGICGNADDNKKTDMITKDGTNASSDAELCRSWLVDDHGKSCEDTGPKSCDSAIQLKATELCSKITEDPFAACKDVVPADDILKGCEYDLCSLVEDFDSQDDLVQSTLCATYKNYADECLSQGTLVNWPKEKMCANYPQCPENAEYKHNITCSPTCSDPRGDFSCPGVPSGGCQCRDGFVEEIGEEVRCVDKYDCGCTHDGVYHELHNTWVNNDCSMKYKCLYSKHIVAWPIDCDTDVYNCIPGAQEGSGCFCSEDTKVLCDEPEGDPSTVPDDNYDPSSHH